MISAVDYDGSRKPATSPYVRSTSDRPELIAVKFPVSQVRKSIFCLAFHVKLKASFGGGPEDAHEAATIFEY